MASARMNSRLDRRAPGRLLLALPLLLVGAAVGAAQVEVAPELERLMAKHGFTMKPVDLEATRDIKGRAEEADLLRQLRILLEGFDHVIVQSPKGGVERVLILGEKAPYVPPALPVAAPNPATEPAGTPGEVVLETQRIGASRAVTLTLEGESGRRVQRVLLVDTGADYVVLPTSVIAQLGIAPQDLQQRQVQTANGPTDAMLGTLPAVWLKEQRVTGVAVAFIDDSRLGGNALLGMSLLGRFRVTIDDE
ncbi:MAG TPA: retropepsin-like aspartic protease, partial [Lamprocystis sp. (in: g-proteobacteria)]|nr:retropepsin-like aspartic protease [Lamprocystis sp. (in: g-proteobacteria)]